MSTVDYLKQKMRYKLFLIGLWLLGICVMIAGVVSSYMTGAVLFVSSCILAVGTVIFLIATKLIKSHIDNEERLNKLIKSRPWQ